MSVLLLDGPVSTAAPIVARRGLVRAERKVVRDDDGLFHPLGVTFFWALYGWKYERPRILDHLAWLAPKRFDYLRILGEVDWTGRSIDPPVAAGNTTPAAWPDYAEQLTGFVEAAYDHGLRCEVSVIGGRQHDKKTGAQRFVPTALMTEVLRALAGREHTVMHYEAANEWDRLDKANLDDLVAMGSCAAVTTPCLTALSRPMDKQEDHDESGYEAMRQATARAGCTGYTLHPERGDQDYGWRHVRQGYDFKDFPGSTWNNEPQGPQSSVEELSNPLQLACARLLGIVCGGAGYVLHVGQGVTGEADPDHDRPQNMWEVPHIDEIMQVVRGVDVLAPDGVENWKVVNNARDDHPLPLDDHDGFWEGSSPKNAVNKNYAALAGDGRWVVMPIGVRSTAPTGPVLITQAARRACHVEAYNPALAYLGRDAARVAVADLAAGARWELPGRADTLCAYLIEGRDV